MSALSIQVPFPVFNDRDGQPLDNGYVWIGVPNLPPQTNPVNVYFDEALTILAPQPLRTINGYVSRAGTPAQLYVDGVNFSILVQDSKGSMVYNFPEGTGIDPNASGIAFTGFKGQIGVVQDLSDDDGSDWIGFEPAGVDAVARSAQDKMRETVSVKDFGADPAASGTVNTAAIQTAFASGAKRIVGEPGAVYSINSQLSVSANQEFDGQGCTFQMSGAFVSLLNIIGSVVVRGVTFKGSSTDGVTEANLAAVTISEGSVVRFYDCVWDDLYGYTRNQYGCEFKANNTDVEFYGCTFKNIRSVGANPPAEGVTPGFCGGVFMQSNSAPATPSRLLISDCLFEDIETVRNPAYVGPLDTDYDADAIRLFISAPDYETIARHDVVVQNCRFHNVQKRAIKNTGVPGVVVNNIYVEGFNSSDVTRPAMAAIVSLQPARSCSISNVYATGRFLYLFRFTASDVSVSNVFFDQRFAGYCLYTIATEDRGSLIEQNLFFSNMVIKGASRLYRTINNTDGSGSSYVIKNVSLNDVYFEYAPNAFTPATDYLLEFSNTQDPVLTNVRCYKGTESYIDARGVLLNRTTNTTLRGCVFEDVKDIALKDTNTGVGSATSLGVTIDNCEFSRAGGVDATDEFIEFSATCTGVTVKNSDITIRATAANLNFNAFRSISASTFVDNVNFLGEGFSTNAFMPFSIVRLGGADTTFRNCNFQNNGPEAALFCETTSGATGFRFIGNLTNEGLISNAAAAAVAMSNTNPIGKTLIAGAGTFVATGNNLQY